MPSEITYEQNPIRRRLTVNEQEIEVEFVRRLCEDLNYTHRPDLRDRASLEATFAAPAVPGQ